MTIGGIVLAGGRGRRLGGGGKATIEVDGMALAARAVAALRDAGCDPIVVVAGPDAGVPDLGVPVVADGHGPAGPLNAVRAGLAHLDTDDVVVLACDLPFAARLVARLTGRAAGSSVVAADADGRVQPLCARYPRARALAAAAAALAEGDHRVVEWARHMGPPAVEHAAGRELLNVNTADDLARARDHVR